MNKLFILFFGVIIFSSCSVLKPSIMLRTGRHYNFTEIPSEAQYEYKIAANDQISFRIYSNDGFKLIDLDGTNNTTNRNTINGLTYLVEYDGLVKLPIIGRVSLDGYTIRKAELMLEEMYSKYYNKPFILLEVINRRVIIFPGTGDKAQVITLENNNITLLEALALAGGISRTGKARRIKLIRGNLRDPKVYLIDLSTIEGMQQADIVLQANDIIYVEPVLKIPQALLSEINSYLALLNSFLLIYALFFLPGN